MSWHRHFLIAMLLAFAAMLVAVHPVLPVQTRTDRKTLLPTADAMMRGDLPNINEGGASGFWVMRNSEVILSYLMFDLAEIPAGSTIEEATLRLHTDRHTHNGTVNLHYCPSNDWTEDDITYNNRPAFQPELLDSVNVTYGVAKWYEWKITGIAASTFRATDTRLSLALDGTDTGVVVFDSRESSYVDRRPQLSVLYSYTPSPGIDPALIILIGVGIVGISGVGFGIVYIRRKRRKQQT